MHCGMRLPASFTFNETRQTTSYEWYVNEIRAWVSPGMQRTFILHDCVESFLHLLTFMHLGNTQKTIWTSNCKGTLTWMFILLCQEFTFPYGRSSLRGLLLLSDYKSKDILWSTLSLGPLSSFAYPSFLFPKDFCLFP